VLRRISPIPNYACIMTRKEVAATAETNPASPRCETLGRNHRARKRIHDMNLELSEMSHGRLSNAHR
jgi:hypothetical protein